MELNVIDKTENCVTVEDNWTPTLMDRLGWIVGDTMLKFEYFRYRLAMFILPKNEHSNLVQHAKKELELSGWYDDDAIYGDLLPESALELVRVFSNQGHSGMSASAITSIVSKLFKYELLSPLTGEDDEWYEVADGVSQNKRCSHVFKDETGVYDMDGKVFVEPNGVTYTSRDSRVYITFPYTPKTEFVHVKGEEE